jgi:hypothetical protein
MGFNFLVFCFQQNLQASRKQRLSIFTEMEARGFFMRMNGMEFYRKLLAERVSRIVHSIIEVVCSQLLSMFVMKMVLYEKQILESGMRK